MKKYNEFINSTRHLQEAKEWVNNRNNIDSQSREKYKLANILFKADYCGQKYAGANNYHESPEEFNSYVCKVIQQEAHVLFEKALKLMQSHTEALLIESESELDEIKNKIVCLKNRIN